MAKITCKIFFLCWQQKSEVKAILGKKINRINFDCEEWEEKIANLNKGLYFTLVDKRLLSFTTQVSKHIL
jgi:hypothetical protein